MSRNYKEESRKSWGPTNERPVLIGDIQIGCLQRIADATELMAKNHKNLIEEKERFERWYKDERAQRESLERSIIAHKANCTRLKNKLEAMKNATENDANVS